MSIVSIHIAPERGGPTAALEQGELVAGRGIKGDHHWAHPNGVPAAEVTLIEAEEVEAFNAETGQAIEPADTRRNLVTRGVALRPLIGQRFSVGEALLEGIEPCDPCATLGRRLQTESISAAAVVKAMLWRGGLRARVVRGGTFALGSEIRTAE